MAKCAVCSLDFEETDAEKKLIEIGREKGMNFVVIQCSRCGLGTEYRLNQDYVGPAPDDLPICRCPTSHCIGWVCNIARIIPGEENKWGCGECGGTWIDDNSLQQSIEEIVERYSHRKNVYVRSGHQWRGVPLAIEPKNYDRLVETEAWE